jgi:hypothetical protein
MSPLSKIDKHINNYDVKRVDLLIDFNNATLRLDILTDDGMENTKIYNYALNKALQIGYKIRKNDKKVEKMTIIRNQLASYY